MTVHAFPFAGVSDCLEVAGLTLWGWHLGRIMLGCRPAESEADRQPLLPDQPVHAKHRVGEVLDCYPHLLATFLAFGFKPLASPWLRNTMAYRVTIAQACRFVGVDTDVLLMRLNQERMETGKMKISLPVIA